MPSKSSSRDLSPSSLTPGALPDPAARDGSWSGSLTTRPRSGTSLEAGSYLDHYSSSFVTLVPLLPLYANALGRVTRLNTLITLLPRASTSPRSPSLEPGRAQTPQLGTRGRPHPSLAPPTSLSQAPWLQPSALLQHPALLQLVCLLFGNALPAGQEGETNSPLGGKLKDLAFFTAK